MITHQYRRGDKVELWCHNKDGVAYLNSHATVLHVSKGQAYISDGYSYGMWVDIDKGKDWPLCIIPESEVAA